MKINYIRIAKGMFKTDESRSDWVLLPNHIISGFAINMPVLNSKKQYHNKLDLMKADGFFIDDWLYDFGE
jgi:hypothetical protein